MGNVTCLVTPPMHQGTILAKHRTFPLVLLTYTESISNAERSHDVNGKRSRGPWMLYCITRAVLVGMKNVSLQNWGHRCLTGSLPLKFLPS